MTEKRFRIYQDIYEVFYIEDVKHWSDKRLQKGYKIGHEEDVKYEDVQDVVELLNALHEENERLKQELFETSKELLWATSDDVDRALYFENEVEDLRKEIFE